MVQSTKKNCKRNELEFPKLMESVNSNGLIVLMTSSGTGTVVKPDGEYTVGEYATSWAMITFRDFRGEVTLKNATD